ncbi:MAG: A/G-specific adenine glycosylase [Candidatus Lokiarchaeota archaeon]|nr:A/G-specific adenine glycosylase [Candidatus Lokiarchaeota archaeon]MBD3340958.1 A/G-specific adenine glycosylase [Candidatus Lokiarchaeota archaeon]
MTDPDNFGLSNVFKKDFQSRVIEWAKKNLVDYPWRQKRTPYKVLISEILLTRTKADQVEPAYEKFIEEYPTVEEFSVVKASKVKNIIKSLGLLFRVNTLNTISAQIKSNHNNSIPNDLKNLKKLKGIGDYGANAILCFGFGLRRPILDSNFIRIYERVFEIKPKTKTAKTDKYLWKFAEFLLPQEHFVQYNYGLLDIGGQICKPRKPNCENCPLTSLCLYYKESRSEQ